MVSRKSVTIKEDLSQRILELSKFATIYRHKMVSVLMRAWQKVDTYRIYVLSHLEILYYYLAKVEIYNLFITRDAKFSVFI